jgi:hypothetical protein
MSKHEQDYDLSRSCMERVATSLVTEDAAMQVEHNAWPRACKALPASRHELLLHLSVRGDRWWWAGNSSCGWVDYRNGIAGALG